MRLDGFSQRTLCGLHKEIHSVPLGLVPNTHHRQFSISTLWIPGPWIFWAAKKCITIEKETDWLVFPLLYYFSVDHITPGNSDEGFFHVIYMLNYKGKRDFLQAPGHRCYNHLSEPWAWISVLREIPSSPGWDRRRFVSVIWVMWVCVFCRTDLFEMCSFLKSKDQHIFSKG